MKLRTRMICICFMATIFATVISSAIMLIFLKKSFENEETMKAYQEFFVDVKTYEDKLNELDNREIIDVYLKYLFMEKDDYYNMCFYEPVAGPVNEIYNHTVFGLDELKSLEYSDESSGKAYDNIGIAELKIDGRHYIVMKYLYNFGGNVYFFHVEDITHVINRIERIAIYMVITVFIVGVIISTAVSIIVKKFLKPLQELGDTTQYMAEGLYDYRIDIKGSDEISQLGESFNKMAEAVETRTKSLEESEKKKTLFMGNLTHELKTPMTAISGYAQTLLSTKLSDADREEALMYIYEECGRLERLSQKMMKLLELSDGDLLELAPVTASTLFENVRKSCSVILSDKDIRLVCEEHGETFMADRDLMTDVIINFVDNAVKASESHSEIRLTSSEKCICVEDFGIGIPEDEQDRILEPFYMIDKSRSRKNGGSGLGLTLSSEIIKHHNCTLKIESEIGQGTRMILQFV